MKCPLSFNFFLLLFLPSPNQTEILKSLAKNSKRGPQITKLALPNMDPSYQSVTGGNGAVTTPTAVTPPDSAAACDDEKQNLIRVINSIEKTLGLLHQLYLTVSSFNVAAQLPLLQRLNGLVMELDSMQRLSEGCSIQIPMEVLNLIDDGKNPDEFTKDVLNSCVAKNQITKGKTDAFKSLRKHLLEELDQTFPEEAENYREIRASSVAESKHLAQAQNSLSNGDVKVKAEH